MWLCNSSIGRKVVMSVSGMALILFLTFHACMNVVALFSAKGYNMICEFLGANWYAVAATVLLVGLICIHIIYGIVLTLQNRKARGNNRYAVTAKPDKVEWSSQNMLVLGIIVLLGLLLHLFNFWYNMMFAELLGDVHRNISPANGFGWIKYTFAFNTPHGKIYTVLYVIWIIAIWFHLVHGFWSALQTVGWSGHVWFKRWKVIGTAFVSIVMAMFLVVVLGFATKTAPSLNCCSEKTELCAEAEGCGHDATCAEIQKGCPQAQEECCAEEEQACPGCHQDTPCAGCSEQKPCENCDAQNAECCNGTAAEEGCCEKCAECCEGEGECCKDGKPCCDKCPECCKNCKKCADKNGECCKLEATDE